MTTYYVDGAVGDNANPGTSEGAGNAWATIDYAMDNVIAGDYVYVKASATYSEDITIDTAGAAQNWITFEGYTTTPGDKGKITISPTTNGLLDTPLSNYYVFKNFIITGPSSNCANLGNYYKFINCEFNNAGSEGIRAGIFVALINCEFKNNTFSGVLLSGSNGRILGCISYGNNSGFNLSGTYSLLYKSVAYSNGSGDGIAFSGDSSTAIGNTIDGEGIGIRGVDLSNNDPSCFIDNIIYDYTTGVYGTATSVQSYASFIGYNLINGATDEYASAIADYPETGYQDITTAPGFKDEANDDYTLSNDSPAINKGLTPGGIT